MASSPRRPAATLPRIWRAIKGTADGLSRNEAGLRAAALAYQGLFSLFPLLLFLIFVGTQILTVGDVETLLDDFLRRALPTESSFEFVDQIISFSIRNRGSIGLAGGLGLLWTASSLLSNLETSLNAIWGSPRRPVLRRRLLAVAGVLSLGTLFVISIALSALPALPFLDQQSALLDILDLGIGLVVEVLLLWVIYWWLPNASVPPLSAFFGALLAAVLWESAQFAFRLYLTSGLTNYDTVYGGLAAAIALILWAYLTGLIVFVGAEFSAAMHREFWDSEAQSARIKEIL
jgi:membrane protein